MSVSVVSGLQSLYAGLKINLSKQKCQDGSISFYNMYETMDLMIPMYLAHRNLDKEFAIELSKDDFGGSSDILIINRARESATKQMVSSVKESSTKPDSLPDRELKLSPLETVRKDLGLTTHTHCDGEEWIVQTAEVLEKMIRVYLENDKTIISVKVERDTEFGITSHASLTIRAQAAAVSKMVTDMDKKKI